VTVVRTWSVGLAGVHGAMVEVEVDMSSGVPGVALVGLPESRSISAEALQLNPDLRLDWSSPQECGGNVRRGADQAGEARSTGADGTDRHSGDVAWRQPHQRGEQAAPPEAGLSAPR
jgi:hypothetical protein